MLNYVCLEPNVIPDNHILITLIARWYFNFCILNLNYYTYKKKKNVSMIITTITRPTKI